MQIYTLPPRGFAANCYVITADGNEAIVIDPSRADVAEELQKLGLRTAYVLLTHCHFDHVGGVPALQASGAKVLCSDKESALVGTAADAFDLAGLPRVVYTPDGVLTDGEKRNLCGLDVQTILTPGHTGGSACYLISDGKDSALFTGDTLFAGSIGRTDLPTGNLRALGDSLKKLAALDDYPVYPGHNEPSTLFAEKKTNPFLRNV